MVNDLKQLLHDNVAQAPPDHLDLASVVEAGRRRARGRRTTVAAGAAGLVAACVGVAALASGLPGGADRSTPASHPPRPDAPTLRLTDARKAVEGRDYEELASYTNRNLDRDNGQYFDGVTDDGLILYRDGPRADQLYPRLALLDPATGSKEWLPRLAVGQSQTWPVELSAERIVLVALDGRRLTAYVLDRGAGEWRAMTWHGLPAVDDSRAQVGPDDRLYVPVPATRGQVPEGGWPTGPDGEADDANAEGDTYDLWSVSLTRASDVRDEHLRVGAVAFTDTTMVWTDSTNGHAGRVHVRDLATGEEHSFDPHAGERCNLLGFGATADRIVMSEYCGTYSRGVRDDRVQVLSTDGDQVVTIQDSDLDGGLVGPEGNLVTLTAYGDGEAGTYLYDLTDNAFLRLSDSYSRWAVGGGPVPGDQFFWNTSTNRGHGSTQHLGRLLD